MSPMITKDPAEGVSVRSRLYKHRIAPTSQEQRGPADETVVPLEHADEDVSDL